MLCELEYDSDFHRPQFSVIFLCVCSCSLCRETNLKFKLGLRVTDERLQQEHQLAAFDGEYGSQLPKSVICYLLKSI